VLRIQAANSSYRPAGKHDQLECGGELAEACASRTHQRRENPPPAGFEDREDHRTPCASVRTTPTTYRCYVSCRRANCIGLWNFGDGLFGPGNSSSLAPHGCHPERSLSSREARRKQTKDLCIPRYPPQNVCSNPEWKPIRKSGVGLGPAIVRNAWVLRREPFAPRRAPLPQDDSRWKFTDPLLEFPCTNVQDFGPRGVRASSQSPYSVPLFSAPPAPAPSHL
jgi:hypothetical protein